MVILLRSNKGFIAWKDSCCIIVNASKVGYDLS